VSMRGQREAPRIVGRSRAAISGDSLVKAHLLSERQSLPLVMSPVVDGIDLVAWAKSNRAQVERELLRCGALLFRGFRLNGVSGFEQFIRAVSSGPLEYHERSSPRTQIGGGIYTSTDHPEDQAIFLHNEQSYNLRFPTRIFFFCLRPASQGGATPLADCRRVFDRLDPDIRERFIEKKYLYVRNFGQGFGLRWQDVFQTDEVSRVEGYCKEQGISFEWRDRDRLTTKQVRRVAAVHPQSGEMTWFNHATFFHVSTLEPAARKTIERAFPNGDFPNNTYYGDGSPIEDHALEGLRAAYNREMVTFEWQAGDLLMIDNMLAAHGRTPFSGPRQVVVGMSDSHHWDNV